MTNEELITKIKTEIDKLYGEYKDKFHQCGDQYHLGLIDGLDMAERVLDTLESEKPMNQDKELNNEIKAFVNEYGYEKSEDILLIAIVARHFAEWGYLRAAEKYDDIEYNRQRAEENKDERTFEKELSSCVSESIHCFFPNEDDDYCEIDSLSFQNHVINIARRFYQLGKQSSCSTTSNDLKEAAEDFVWEVMENDEDGISDLCRKLRPTSKISDFYDALAEFFIAGAKWQAEQLLKSSPLPEDTVLFNKGVAEGRRLMMEEAVEGKVFMSFAPGHNQMVMVDVDLPTNTKVKVIVIKEDEK